MKTRALGNLTRISNLPTVVTNALVGVALGGGGAGWGDWALALGAVTLFYCGGMALNDVVDAAWDREHKRERPIARGDLSLNTGLTVSAVCLFGGAALAVVPGFESSALGLGLLLSIVLYNALHKRFVFSVVFMGCCRLLAVGLPCVMVGGWPGDPRAWWYGALLGAYTVLLTLAARGEDGGTRSFPRLLGWLTMLAPLGAAALFAIPVPEALAPAGVALVLVALVSAALWTARCASCASRGGPLIKAGVLGWLAGFCLIDAVVLASIGEAALAGAAIACFVLTTLGHRVILGT